MPSPARAGSSLGVFRAGNGGVVFLDEIGEMPLDLQPKLLRVLQQREVTPVGASRPVKIDVQVIAATNRNLEKEVVDGRFREDLYYRLNMVELRVPALRQRPEDIPELIEFFSERFAGRYGRPLWRPDSETVQRFCEYHWPGNIRQLAQVIEQSYVLDCVPALPESSAARREQSLTLPFLNLERAAQRVDSPGPASDPRAQRPRGQAVGRASQYADPPAKPLRGIADHSRGHGRGVRPAWALTSRGASRKPGRLAARHATNRPAQAAFFAMAGFAA